ncbi:MAG: ROK family transcriptional regulator [Shinella sp.]|nr:ROK family transcriptional regulator [Shinella sp.]
MLTKSSTELVRQQNSVLVLATLRRFGPLSHTDLSERTGLASATVSVITAELERARILEKREQQAATGRGRPRVLFQQRRGSAYLIAVRIASDLVQYSLADYAGTLIDRFEEPRNNLSTSAASFTQGFLDALERLVQRSRIDRDAVLSISISSKGIVDSSARRLIWSPVFGLEQIDFAALLSPAWRAKVTLSNETLLVADALAARMDTGGEAGFRGLAALSLGHSVGLGIARRDRFGELQVSAPNFGHMPNSEDGKLCRCGSSGCIEASAGFYGILRMAFEVPPDTIPAKFVPIAEMDKIALRARQGHRMSEYAFRQAGLALGKGLSRMLSLYENMPVVFTGPGTRYFDLLSRGIEEGLIPSQHVRLQGLPQMTISPEEATLVLEGHLHRALAEIDDEIAAVRMGNAPPAEGG